MQHLLPRRVGVLQSIQWPATDLTLACQSIPHPGLLGGLSGDAQLPDKPLEGTTPAAVDAARWFRFRRFAARLERQRIGVKRGEQARWDLVRERSTVARLA